MAQTITNDEGKWVQVQRESQREVCAQDLLHLDAWVLVSDEDHEYLQLCEGFHDLRPPSSLPKLQPISTACLRRRVFLLTYLANRLKQIVNSLCFLPQKGIDHETPSQVLQRVFSLSHKERLVNAVIEQTQSSSTSRPLISIQRLRPQESPHKDLPVAIKKTVFAQVCSQLAGQADLNYLVANRVWKVKFLGEGVDDAGGGYSESISEMMEELTTFKVPLLIKTPNCVDEIGPNRDVFLLNPAAKSEEHLQFFRFLGCLIGIAVRTKSPIAIPLAPCVWQQLLGTPLTIEDLNSVAQTFVQGLQFVSEFTGSAEDLEALMLPTKVFSADGITSHPAVPGEVVTASTKQHFVSQALEFRLHEFDQQVASVRSGIASVLPLPLMRLFTPTQFRNIVCGAPEFPLALLQSMTRVKGALEDSKQVTWFWQAMSALSQEEQALFLRFVCGRTRLPRNEGDFDGKYFILHVLDRYEEGSAEADNALPEAQTCFFTLRLPKYSSATKLLAKLRYAIHVCKSIDTDNYARTNLEEEPDQ